MIMMEVYIEEATSYLFEGPSDTDQFAHLILQLINMKSNDRSIIEVRTYYGTDEIKVVQLIDNATYSPVDLVKSYNGRIIYEDPINVASVSQDDLYYELGDDDNVEEYFIGR